MISVFKFDDHELPSLKFPLAGSESVLLRLELCYRPFDPGIERAGRTSETSGFRVCTMIRTAAQAAAGRMGPAGPGLVTLVWAGPVQRRR